MKSIPTVTKDIFVLLGIAILVWLAYFWVNFNGLVAPDAMHYATIARNIVRGNGMRADDAYVGEIAILRTDVFRVTRNPPLYPLFMALFFKLFGISDNSAVISSAFFYFLSIPVVFLLGKQLFNRKVAWFAALLYITDLNVLYYSVSSLAEPLFIFLLLLSFSLLHKSSSPKYFFLTGTILGLSRLVKINAVFFVLPFLFYSWLFEEKSRLKNSLCLLAGFVILNLPEIIRGYILLGDPVFSGYSYGIYHFQIPSSQIANSFVSESLPSWWQNILSAPYSFIGYYLRNIERHYVFFVSSMKAFILAFFIAGILRWYPDKKLNLFKAVVLLSIIIQLFMLSVSRQESRYFHVFIPLILIFSMEFMTALFSKLQFKNFFVRNAAITCLVVLLTYPLGLNYASAFQEKRMTPGNSGFLWIKNLLDKYTVQNDIVLSDFPWLSWYVDRRMVGLPLSTENLKKLEEKVDITAILLTNTPQGMLKNDAGTFMKDWRDTFDNPFKSVGRYRLIDAFVNNSGDRVVLYKK